MNMSQLANEALQLDPKDRAILAETLWESLKDPYIVSPDLSDEESIGLAKQRDDQMENNEVISIPHSELMNRLRGNED